MSAYFDLDKVSDREAALKYLASGIVNPRRNGEQNRMFHATLGEIAAAIPWAGKHREVEVWKRLITAAWLRAEGEQIEVLPALDGHGVDLVYAPTHTLSKGQFTSLMEYTLAFAAEHGIEAAC